MVIPLETHSLYNEINFAIKVFFKSYFYNALSEIFPELAKTELSLGYGSLSLASSLQRNSQKQKKSKNMECQVVR